jgi:hypothetical protein
MNTRRLSIGIWVLSANNETGMVRLLGMKPNKLSPVQCKDGPIVLCGIAQHLLIGKSLIGIASVQGCQHIVAQSAQGLYNL